MYGDIPQNINELSTYYIVSILTALVQTLNTYKL